MRCDECNLPVNRATCDGCSWYVVIAETIGTGIHAAAHYCYRDPGCPSVRAITLSSLEAPIACTERWEE